MGEVGKKATKKPAKATKGFTDEERAAMKERVQEQKARLGAGKADGESRRAREDRRDAGT